MFKNDYLKKFSIRKFSVGVASVVVGLSFLGSPVTTVSASENTVKKEVSYQYVLDTQLTAEEKQQLVAALPQKADKNDTYYMVYQSNGGNANGNAVVSAGNENSGRVLPKTGVSSPQVGMGLGVGTLVIGLALSKKKRRAIVTSLFVVTATGTIAVSAIEGVQLSDYNKTVTVTVGQELPDVAIDIPGHTFLGYVALDTVPDVDSSVGNSVNVVSEENVTPPVTEVKPETTPEQPETTPVVEEKPAVTAEQPVTPPVVEEKPAVTAEQPVTPPVVEEKPAVTEEQPVTPPVVEEKPAVTEEQPVTPPVVEVKPVVTAEQPVTPPVVEEKPEVTEEQPVTPPVVEEKPEVTEEQPVTPPVVEEKPEVTEEQPVTPPATEEKPEVAEEQPVTPPVVEEQPAVTEEQPVTPPVVEEKPEVTEEQPVEQPVTEVKPEVTAEQPVTTPVVEEKPAVTKEQPETAPVVEEKPAVTAEQPVTPPVVEEKPEVTEEQPVEQPVTEVKPEVTGEQPVTPPVTEEKPEVTEEQPVTTPVVEEKPAVTAEQPVTPPVTEVKPEVTGEQPVTPPVVEEKPAVTAEQPETTPVVEEKPAVTEEKPVEDVKPGETTSEPNTDVPTETPEVSGEETATEKPTEGNVEEKPETSETETATETPVPQPEIVELTLNKDIISYGYKEAMKLDLKLKDIAEGSDVKIVLVDDKNNPVEGYTPQVVKSTGETLTHTYELAPLKPGNYLIRAEYSDTVFKNIALTVSDANAGWKDKLDYSKKNDEFYWFDELNRPHVYTDAKAPYDPTKPTIIFIHGWQNEGVKNNTAPDFNYEIKYTAQDGGKSVEKVINVNSVKAWKDAGYNVGMYNWTQIADEEGEGWTGLIPYSAEAKVWVPNYTNYRTPMRYRLNNGKFILEPNKTAADLFVEKYLEAMKDYQGDYVVFAGHSLGNQMAIRSTALILEQAEKQAINRAIVPDRLALLDPYYGDSDRYAVYKGKKTTTGDAAVAIAKDLVAKNIVIDMFKSSILTTSGWPVGDQNRTLEDLAAYTRVYPESLGITAQHSAGHQFYFWAKQSGNPFYMKTDAEVASLMGGFFKVEHTQGKDTVDPSDDKGVFKTTGKYIPATNINVKFEGRPLNNTEKDNAETLPVQVGGYIQVDTDVFPMDATSKVVVIEKVDGDKDAIQLAYDGYIKGLKPGNVLLRAVVIKRDNKGFEIGKIEKYFRVNVQ